MARYFEFEHGKQYITRNGEIITLKALGHSLFEGTNSVLYFFDSEEGRQLRWHNHSDHDIMHPVDLTYLVEKAVKGVNEKRNEDNQ